MVPDRRRFLRASAIALAAGASALAGCPADEGDDGETAGEGNGGDEAPAATPGDGPDGDGAPDEDAPTPAEEVQYDDPAGSVRFVRPEDGAEVGPPVDLEMEAEGFTVEPAAEGVRDGHGHLHVVVDAGCVEPGEPIPHDEGYEHYGDGQTEAELALEPGEYDLCLQAGDGERVAYDLTDEISITVVE